MNRTLLIEVNIYYLVLCLCKGDTSGGNKDLDVISSSLRKSPGACMYPVFVEKNTLYIIIIVMYVMCVGVHSWVHAKACVEVGRKFSWIVSFLPALGSLGSRKVSLLNYLTAPRHFLRRKYVLWKIFLYTVRYISWPSFLLNELTKG